MTEVSIDAREVLPLRLSNRVACGTRVSRPGRTDAQGAAVALSGDLARLRHLLVRLDVDSGEVDVNLHEAISARLQPRQEDSVVVIGQVHVSFDYETDGEHP